MTDASIDELSREIARALAANWRTAWTEYGKDFVSDADLRHTVGRHAWNLLELTGRVWQVERTPEVVDLAFAASMLRELADGFALMSTAWTTDEVSQLPFPVRDWLNIVLSALALDRWCRGFGETLELDPPVSEVTWGPLPLSKVPEDLAACTRAALHDYRSFLTRIETGGDVRSRFNDREELRTDACRGLAAARRDVFALRAAGAGESRVTIASVRVMLAESMFLVAGARDAGELERLPIIRADVLSDLSRVVAAD